jgi:hypothetical protein
MKEGHNTPPFYARVSSTQPLRRKPLNELFGFFRSTRTNQYNLEAGEAITFRRDSLTCNNVGVAVFALIVRMLRVLSGVLI